MGKWTSEEKVKRVLKLTAQGFSTGEIREITGVSPGTIVAIRRKAREAKEASGDTGGA